MDKRYSNLTLENLENEHICCAIADNKHQHGVDVKKAWLKDRIGEGHVFRKLDEKGKVFIEYAPLDKAWVPVVGENYLFVYCLWVSGKFKGKGYGKELIEYCISDAKAQGRSGICVISARKKKPFLSDRKFMESFGLETVDTAGDEYLLMALSFDGTMPRFSDGVKEQSIDSNDLTIYYGLQCPYIPDCVKQIKEYCEANSIPLSLRAVDTLAEAKSLPCVFNNWAVFYKGTFETVHLLNEGYLRKLLEKRSTRDEI